MYEQTQNLMVVDAPALQPEVNEDTVFVQIDEDLEAVEEAVN
jgi:hypothetical protein